MKPTLFLTAALTCLIISNSYAATSPKIVWVDDDGVEVTKLDILGYKTINEAISKVAVNGTVNVLPGKYAQAFITKSLQLYAKKKTAEM